MFPQIATGLKASVCRLRFRVNLSLEFTDSGFRALGFKEA